MSDYFKTPAANVSKLKILLDKTPAHLRHQIDNPSESESESLIIGRAIHCLMFEQKEEFWNQFILLDVDKRTKSGKEEWANAEKSGKTPLNAKQSDLVFSLETALKENDTIMDLLDEGEGEKEIYGEIDGVACKAKMDWYRNGIIVDLKTVQDGSAEGFGKQVASYSYDMQAAFYKDLATICGLKVDHFVFIVVEKTAPFLTSTFIATDDVINNGRKKYTKTLEIWRECHAQNVWSGYPLGIQELKLPTWAGVSYE